jgi:hypothetical protein
MQDRSLKLKRELGKSVAVMRREYLQSPQSTGLKRHSIMIQRNEVDLLSELTCFIRWCWHETGNQILSGFSFDQLLVGIRR